MERVFSATFGLNEIDWKKAEEVESEAKSAYKCQCYSININISKADIVWQSDEIRYY